MDSKKYREYARLRNQIRNQARKNRKNIEKTIAAEIKNKSKAFLAYVNSKTKSRSEIPDLEYKLNNATKLTSSDKEKAEVLSSFFASVFTKEPAGDLLNMETQKS